MDYLQTSVNRFRTKRKTKPLDLPLSAILNRTLHHSWRVNHEQVQEMLNYAREFTKEKTGIRASDMPMKLQQEIILAFKEDLIEKLRTPKIGISTMCELLTLCDAPENSDIKSSLLDILFSGHIRSFIDSILATLRPVDNLQRIQPLSNEEVDVYVYGKPFKKIRTTVTIANSLLVEKKISDS